MSTKEECYLWMRDLADALQKARRIAEDGGASGFVNGIDKMLTPLSFLVQSWREEIEAENLVATLAGVEKTSDDVCIINVPKHWIDAMRNKAVGQSQESGK